MAYAAAAGTFEDLAGIVSVMGRLRLGDFRSMHLWALVWVASATVRRIAGQPCRNISCRCRYRSRAAGRRVIDLPGSQLGIETRSPQPITIALPPNPRRGGPLLCGARRCSNQCEVGSL